MKWTRVGLEMGFRMEETKGKKEKESKSKKEKEKKKVES